MVICCPEYAAVCLSEPSHEVAVPAQIWRLPLPPYLSEGRWYDGVPIRFGVAKPMWGHRHRYTLRFGVTDRLTIIVAPDENGMGAGFKLRF